MAAAKSQAYPSTRRPADNRHPSSNATKPSTGAAIVSASYKQFKIEIEKYQSLLDKVIPAPLQRGGIITTDRMIGLALKAYLENPDMKDVTISSIINSVCIIAQLGLEFQSPLGQAYLIPFKGVCTAQIGYRGLITLALRSPRVNDVQAQVVLQQDSFYYEYGTDAKLVHKPAQRYHTDFNVEADWTDAYAILSYRDGGRSSFVVMDRSEVERVRDTSSQAKDNLKGPWKMHYEEMVRKTPAKRLMKFQDLSSQISYAVGVDDQAEAGLIQDNVIDADYEDLTPGAEPKTTTGAVPGTGDGQKAADSDKKATGLRVNDFSEPEFEELKRNFLIVQPTGNDARLQVWVERFVGTKEEAIETSRRAAAEVKKRMTADNTVVNTDADPPLPK